MTKRDVKNDKLFLVRSRVSTIDNSRENILK